MIPQSIHFRWLLKVLIVTFTLALAVILLFTSYVISQFSGTASFPADCIIVFGAAVHGEGDPGPGITRRTATAARLYGEEKVRKIFLTGGKGSETQESEAAVMRKVAMLHGIDPDAIVLEESAQSTWENIEKTKPLTAECQHTVAVSDRYHLARIEYLASKQNWKELETYPADQHASLYFEFKSVLREALAIGYYITQ